MVFVGFVIGIVGGATPGLAGPFLMAISLPILLSIFGFTRTRCCRFWAFLWAS